MDRTRAVPVRAGLRVPAVDRRVLAVGRLGRLVGRLGRVVGRLGRVVGRVLAAVVHGLGAGGAAGRL